MDQTLFSRFNAPKAGVYDNGVPVEGVTLINTATGEIVCEHVPYRIDSNGEFDTYRVQYRSIHAIYAGEPYPILFCCYDKMH